MIKWNQLLTAISLLLTLTQSPTATAQAQMPGQRKSIEVFSDQSVDPISVTGLILSNTATLEVPIKDLVKSPDNKLIATLDLSQIKLPPGALATAVLLSKDGELALANVREINDSTPDTSFLNIPSCQPEVINTAALAGQTGLIDSLVQLRLERRRLAVMAISKSLSGEFLERLQKLESGFGFHNSDPLSANLPPVELVNRLSRILQAINNFELGKDGQNATASEASK